MKPMINQRKYYARFLFYILVTGHNLCCPDMPYNCQHHCHQSPWTLLTPLHWHQVNHIDCLTRIIITMQGFVNIMIYIALLVITAQLCFLALLFSSLLLLFSLASCDKSCVVILQKVYYHYHYDFHYNHHKIHLIQNSFLSGKVSLA